MSGIVKPPYPSRLDFDNPLSQGLVGCWLMNEGAGSKVYDISGRGNDGTLTNMAPATDWVVGDSGSGLKLSDDNDYVVMQCPDITSYTTLSRCNLLTTSANWAPIYFAKTIVGNNNKCVFQRYSNTTHLAIYNQDYQPLQLTLEYSQCANRLSDIAISYNNQSKKVSSFLDGAIVDYLDYSYQPTAGGAYLWLGHSSLSHHMTCESFLFYNRALSAEEISLLYHNPYQMVWRPGMIAYSFPSAPEPEIPTIIVPRLFSRSLVKL